MNVGFELMLTAVVIKTRSPQTTGLEWARPGIGVFHRALVDCHFVGRPRSSATPAAFGPRNEGQFCADAVAAASNINAGHRSFLNWPLIIFWSRVSANSKLLATGKAKSRANGAAYVNWEMK